MDLNLNNVFSLKLFIYHFFNFIKIYVNLLIVTKIHANGIKLKVLKQQEIF